MRCYEHSQVYQESRGGCASSLNDSNAITVMNRVPFARLQTALSKAELKTLKSSVWKTSNRPVNMRLWEYFRDHHPAKAPLGTLCGLCRSDYPARLQKAVAQGLCSLQKRWSAPTSTASTKTIPTVNSSYTISIVYIYLY